MSVKFATFPRYCELKIDFCIIFIQSYWWRFHLRSARCVIDTAFVYYYLIYQKISYYVHNEFKKVPIYKKNLKNGIFWLSRWLISQNYRNRQTVILNNGRMNTFLKHNQTHIQYQYHTYTIHIWIHIKSSIKNHFLTSHQSLDDLYRN